MLFSQIREKDGFFSLIGYFKQPAGAARAHGAQNYTNSPGRGEGGKTHKKSMNGFGYEWNKVSIYFSFFSRE